MRVFAISDLHLALSEDKPMDIFGPAWENYMQRIDDRWNLVVAQDDLVLLPGDLSWATYLNNSKHDFMYLAALPGKKIISKGNHDYWWTTHSKLSKFLQELSIQNISFLQNNAYFYEDFVVVGTRGWKNPKDEGFTEGDEKIYNREMERLKLSLSHTKGFNGTKIAMLHYPPFSSKSEATGFVDVMQSFGVDICVYGHLHGRSSNYAIEGLVDGIRYHLVSADYLKFEPLYLGEW